MIPNNACTLRITAAAGTELAGASFGGTVRLPSCLNVNHSSLPTEVYDPRAFIPHAALLGQAFAHCPKFPTAASRRSRGRVSVPVWLVILSDQLPVEALVGRYPTSELIARRPISQRVSLRSPFEPEGCPPGSYAVLAAVSRGCPPLGGRLSTCYATVRH